MSASGRKQPCPSAKAQLKEFQIYNTNLKPDRSGFAYRRSATKRLWWTRTMPPRPNLDLLTCVVAVTAAVLVAIARCTSCTLRLPD